MRLIETVAADLAVVASGAWQKEPYSKSPEQKVKDSFTAAMHYYTTAFDEAYRILGITRGTQFTGRSQEERRNIVLDLGLECRNDRNAFTARFREDELEASYQAFLEGDSTKWAKYMSTRQAVDNLMAFTEVSPKLQVELPSHQKCRYWEPENLDLQTRFARHLGILKPGQDFGDLEENPDVVVVNTADKDQLVAIQKQRPAVVFVLVKTDGNPFPAYIPFRNQVCHSMEFPSIYDEGIKTLVKLAPNILISRRPITTSIRDAIESKSASPTITLEIDPKLFLPE